MDTACGSGSQGSVVLAKFNGELVCVKVFSSAKVFSQELKMLQAAQKTGYVPNLKGAHCSDKGNFIVMSYHGKVTLEDFIQSNPSPKKVHKTLNSLSVALQALHDSGIVHNDIKENNILIEGRSQNGRSVTIIDFGWSTYLGQSPYPHLTKSQIKDFPWIAPWLANGGKSSSLSDIYSLGFLFQNISDSYKCPAYNIFGYLLTSLKKCNFNLGLNLYGENQLELNWKHLLSLGLKEIAPMISEKACYLCASGNDHKLGPSPAQTHAHAAAILKLDEDDAKHKMAVHLPLLSIAPANPVSRFNPLFPVPHTFGAFNRRVNGVGVRRPEICEGRTKDGSALDYSQQLFSQNGSGGGGEEFDFRPNLLGKY